jgi:hypothetical protein
MLIPAFIKSQTEHRAHSIYPRGEVDSGEVGEIFSDPELSLSLKFSALFAAFADLRFPLRLSDFRSLIPDPVWHEHCRFRRTSMRTGFWPIFCDEGEWNYELRIGPESRYGPHLLHLVADSAIFDDKTGAFAPPLDSSVVRFTLCHPFLEPELHDPSGIYLFKSG